MEIERSKIKFPDNILDNYDLSTYHFKLYMLPEKTIQTATRIEGEAKFTALDPRPGIIIAESGVTGQIFIESIDIVSYVSMGSYNRNITLNNVTISLREFSGASLFDKIYAASLDLGIKNYAKTPYFLELSFKGRHRITGDAVTIPGSWRWPIVITKVETEVDKGGSSYVMTAFHYDDLSQHEVQGLIDKAIGLEGISTVDAALSKLEKSLNTRASEKIKMSLADKYEIEIDPEYARMAIVSPTDTTSQSSNTVSARTNRQTAVESSGRGGRSRSSSQGVDNTTRGFAIEKNSLISDAINLILSSAPNYHKLITQSIGNTDSGDTNNPNKFKQLHRIITRTEILGWDPYRGDYHKKYIFEIIPYQLPILHSGPRDTTANPVERIAEYVKEGRLQKQYNYLFTGANDQVLNFDLKFNMGWYVNLPPQGGTKTQSYSVTEGHTFSVNSDKFSAMQERVRQRLAILPELKSTTQQRRRGNRPAPAQFDLKDVTALTNSIEVDINNSNLSDQEKDFLKLQTQVTIHQRLPSGLAQSYKEQMHRAYATEDDELNNPTLRNRYIEDYSSTEAKIIGKINTANRIVPVTYLETSQSDETSNINRSIEGGINDGREYTNSMFQQAFQGGSGDLVNIELTVKGDPYWLGNPNSSDNFIPENGENGMVAFMLTTNTPDLAHVTSHTIGTRPSTITGIYGVRQVDHSFTNGRFEQLLYGVRDELSSDPGNRKLSNSIPETSAQKTSELFKTLNDKSIIDRLEDRFGKQEP